MNDVGLTRLTEPAQGDKSLDRTVANELENKHGTAQEHGKYGPKAARWPFSVSKRLRSNAVIIVEGSVEKDNQEARRNVGFCWRSLK